MPSRPRTPQSLFDFVAPYYDVVNSCLSAGLDRHWRNLVVRLLELKSHAVVLDVATGTASMALAIAKVAPSDIHVIGCDLNERMLEVGRRRIGKRGYISRIDLACCSGNALPFADNIFHAVTIAFAIDDMPDREACVREIFRVLKACGSLVLLELSLPEQRLIRSLYRFYMLLLPAVGGLFHLQGYKHLREEILAYRGGDAVEQLLEGVGFVQYRRETLSGGLATVHRAIKPGYNIC